MVHENTQPFYDLARIYSKALAGRRPTKKDLQTLLTSSRFSSLEHLAIPLVLDSLRNNGPSIDLLAELLDLLWSAGMDMNDVSARLAHLSPANPRIRSLSKKFLDFRPVTGVHSIIHVAFYLSGDGNLGDRILPSAVGRAITPSESGIERKHVHQRFTADEIAGLGADHHVVVGGGGLILPDTRPNSRSGWQWNISDDDLRALAGRVGSISLFSVGVNLFSASEQLSRRAHRSLNVLAEVATVLGIRNHGSIARLMQILPQEYHGKISYCPCPTVLGFDGNCSVEFKNSLDARNIGINIAYDRSDRRFRNQDAFESQLVEFCREMVARGTRISVLAHLKRDEAIAQALQRAEVAHTLEPLYALPIARVKSILRELDLVVAMRGHAQMIPFGEGIPFVTLNSHPKTVYFAQDAGLEDLVVDVNSPSVSADLIEACNHLVSEWPKYRMILPERRRLMSQAIDETKDRIFG